MMTMTKVKGQMDILFERHPLLGVCKNDIQAAFDILSETYHLGGKLLVAGNGGSAADSEHIVGELMKGFKKQRRLSEEARAALLAVDERKGTVLSAHLQGALPAIALDGHSALSTAYMNDCEPLLCFAQQVNGFGQAGDVFMGIDLRQQPKHSLCGYSG